MSWEIDLFVIDEAYKLQESVRNQRAYKLSETFLDSMAINSKKIFLFTLRAIFEEFDKYEFYMFKSDFNAVDKNYVVLEDKNFFYVLLEKGSKKSDIHPDWSVVKLIKAGILTHTSWTNAKVCSK